MATAGDVMDRAALCMNDINKNTYTYSVQLPYLKMAWDRLRAILDSISQPVFKEVSSVITYTADATTINKPADLFIPLDVFEREAGSTDDDSWVPVVQKEWEPLGESTDKIGFWAWREQQIAVRPCSENRDVLIRYVKNPAEISSDATTISVDNCVNFLAFKTAEFLAKYIAHNDAKAAILNLDATEEQAYIEGNSIKQMQFQSVRRKPYRAQSRRFWIGRGQ